MHFGIMKQETLYLQENPCLNLLRLSIKISHGLESLCWDEGHGVFDKMTPFVHTASYTSLYKMNQKIQTDEREEELWAFLL